MKLTSGRSLGTGYLFVICFSNLPLEAFVSAADLCQSTLYELQDVDDLGHDNDRHCL